MGTTLLVLCVYQYYAQKRYPSACRPRLRTLCVLGLLTAATSGLGIWALLNLPMLFIGLSAVSTLFASYALYKAHQPQYAHLGAIRYRVTIQASKHNQGPRINCEAACSSQVNHTTHTQ